MYLGNDPAMNPRSTRQATSVRKFMRRLRAGEDVRTDKIRTLKSDITTGTYENDLKLSVALDRLLDEVIG